MIRNRPDVELAANPRHRRFEASWVEFALCLVGFPLPLASAARSATIPQPTCSPPQRIKYTAGVQVIVDAFVGLTNYILSTEQITWGVIMIAICFACRRCGFSFYVGFRWLAGVGIVPLLPPHNPPRFAYLDHLHSLAVLLYRGISIARQQWCQDPSPLKH